MSSFLIYFLAPTSDDLRLCKHSNLDILRLIRIGHKIYGLLGVPPVVTIGRIWCTSEKEPSTTAGELNTNASSPGRTLFSG